MAGRQTYIIDGYNVILGSRWSFDRGDIEQARERFLECLGRYARGKQVSLTVVWDGKGPLPRQEKVRGVRSMFTIPEVSADQKIVRMVEKASNPRSITVVSDDRRHITGIARNLGAQVMGVGRFLDLVQGPAYGGKRAPGGECASTGREPEAEIAAADDLSVDEWLRLFRKRSGE